MKTTRRKFIASTTKVAAFTIVGSPLFLQNAMACSAPLNLITAVPFSFSQVVLPYTLAALEPSIDAQTMDIHYNKHHAAYVKNVNEVLQAENIVVNSEVEFFSNMAKYSTKARNNGGGAWNHNFFWQSMQAASGNINIPTGKLAEAINTSFGSFEKFKEQFAQAALTRFGSGWAWLVKEGDALKIGSTPNQDNPLMGNVDFKGTPLLALDVWEHAYYLKYQNKRNEYIANWWSVVNWNEVAKRI
jgi:superoxide dismutase, Fe-Mn family